MPNLEYCKKRLEAARKYRGQKDFYQRWKRCYNYYMGNHWRKTLPAEHPKIVMNICLNFVESLVSSLLTQSPQAYVVAMNDTIEDYDACEAMTAAFSHWAERQDFQRVLRLGKRNCFIYGTNHFKVWYDNQVNDGLGEVKVDAVSPFSLFHDPHATSLEDCEFIIQGSYVSAERIKRVSGRKLPEESGRHHEMSPEETNIEGSVLIYEGWFEGGKSVVWFTDEQVLAQGQNDYWHGKFPYVRDVDTEIPDEYEGVGMIEPIMSLQREINETRSQRLIYSRFHTYPWTVVDSGAVKNPERFTNEPNLIIEKERGTEIRREYAPPMPAHLMNMPESTMSAAERVLGIREIPQGGRPSNIVSGRGLEVVAQFAGQRIEGTKARPLEQVIRQVSTLVIALMQQFYRGPRVFTYWQDGEMMKDYMPEQFPLIPFSVRVEPGTTLAVNKVARSQEAMQLIQMRLIDAEYLFRTLQLPGWREMMKRMQMQQMQQSQMMAEQGGIPGMTSEGIPAMNAPDETGGIGNPRSDLSNLPTQELLGRMGRNMGMRPY